MKKFFSLLFFIYTIISAQSSDDLKGIKICIDPGHGGHNAANDRHVIPNPGIDFWESESNFQKALLLRPMLQARGATVYLTRETNDYPNDADEPTLSARDQFANSNNVNWFHSIHSNATGGTNTSTNYTLVLVKEIQTSRQPATWESVEMSELIYKNIRAKDRTSSSGGNISGYPGVYKDYTFYGGTSGGFNLGVLNSLLMPGELSEGSFHDYYPETRRLMNNDYRKGEAYGIYNAFVEYFGVPFDTVGIICGTQTSGGTPLNNITVRLLPVNKVYTGDSYNNGYFLFDSLSPGTYKVVFETPSYPNDTVNVTISSQGKLVTGSTPETNSTGISRDIPITIIFANAADTTAVRNAFSISPAIPGTLSWNGTNTTMTFTPLQPFDFKTAYTVKLNGMGNNPQPTVFVDNTAVTTNVNSTSYIFSFTTIPLPPYVSQTQPVAEASNFSITSSIGFRFSEPMDTASIKNAITIVPATPLAYTFTQSNTVVLLRPASGNYSYGTDYTVTVQGSAASAAGIFLDGNRDTVTGDSYILHFRTQDDPTGIARDETAPVEYALFQNFPNPFNPSTTISFSIREKTFVTLTVYDGLGREITTLVHQELGPGRHFTTFDPDRISSGIYFYRLATPSFTDMKKMILLK